MNAVLRDEGQRSERYEIDHLPSIMCRRDRPAPSRPEDYSGWSRVTNDRRRGASLISFSPEMTTDRHITVFRYSRMWPTLAASASRKHFALFFVALHHVIDHRTSLDHWSNSILRDSRNTIREPEYLSSSFQHEDARTLASSFYRTNRQEFLFYCSQLSSRTRNVIGSTCCDISWLLHITQNRPTAIPQNKEILFPWKSCEIIIYCFAQ